MKTVMLLSVFWEDFLLKNVKGHFLSASCEIRYSFQCQPLVAVTAGLFAPIGRSRTVSGFPRSAE